VQSCQQPRLLIQGTGETTGKEYGAFTDLDKVP
jgi:hypothetical protein